ncbi:multidrug transporter subunit MdtA, partial [Shigella flexneri]|nr:multidrug transporter subunit MdtA [Shigella flexneri]
ERQLRKDKASLGNGAGDVGGYEQVGKRNLVSGQEVDAQEGVVSETEGSIKADEGSVASGQLHVEWSRMRAPVDGRVGVKQV